MIVKTKSFIGSLENHRKILKHLKVKQYNQNQIKAIKILKTLAVEYNVTWITENADRWLKQ
jgi:hypothetical protein